MKIPRCMSTQHPDNVNAPFFSESSEIGGEEEIIEAYYAFSHIGCDEQMWDCEGKEIDNYVVKKLLTKYKPFFDENRLGSELFLTFRVPNPTIEKAEAKILIETLESIPRSFDASNSIYKDDIAPIFEVILPMTTSFSCIDRVYRYYKDFVAGKQDKVFKTGDVTIAEWIGRFLPKKINVIPLVENMESILNAHNILKNYLQDKKVEYQRVFFARSDPALNYGLISAILINKIALQNIFKLSDEINTPIYPIIGVGSAPFRGNLTPKNAERVIKEYPSSQTFTIQSAFKYDHPLGDIRKAIDTLQQRKMKRPQIIESEKCLDIIKKYTKEYTKQIIVLAPIINKISRFFPKRRKRKLHIGLFGYSRSVGDSIVLPRAITFTGSLYSLGIPPEILGLNALNFNDIDIIKTYYNNFDEDLKDALKYYNPEPRFLIKEIDNRISDLALDFKQNERHKKITDQIVNSIKRNKVIDLSEEIVMAANIRKFLG